MSVKTMVPQLCDINLASSKYILEKYTDYLEYLGKFVSQIETAALYRDTFFDNNSINNRIEFFNNLQDKFKTFSESGRPLAAEAKALAHWVLPTDVGPRSSETLAVRVGFLGSSTLRAMLAR